MAHPDLIKKYNGEFTSRVPFEKYHQAAELFADALIDFEVGMEVNTKGCEQRDGEVFPTEEILALYITKSKKLEKDPIITLGSDAHKLSDVGKHLVEGAKLVQKNGVDFVMRFDKRKSFDFPL
jgi:histidinol-phosphatase (PHP family)